MVGSSFVRWAHRHHSRCRSPICFRDFLVENVGFATASHATIRIGINFDWIFFFVHIFVFFLLKAFINSHKCCGRFEGSSNLLHWHTDTAHTMNGINRIVWVRFFFFFFCSVLVKSVTAFFFGQLNEFMRRAQFNVEPKKRRKRNEIIPTFFFVFSSFQINWNREYCAFLMFGLNLLAL